MSGITIENDQRTPLDALDRNLPFLASQAAIELDNLRLGRPTDLSAVHDLAKRLGDSTSDVDEHQERQSLMNPPTVSVVSEAFAATDQNEIHTMAELIHRAWEMSEIASSITRENEKLETLCRFFVALSQQASSMQQSVYHQRPLHPNRR